VEKIFEPFCIELQSSGFALGDFDNGLCRGGLVIEKGLIIKYDPALTGNKKKQLFPASRALSGSQHAVVRLVYNSDV
jgi:hypothetical protein